MARVAITPGTIGEKLRKAREARSITIPQVQKLTRIHSSVLMALEEGRCDEILSPMYTKSYLKKYAAFLGVDGNEVLKEYSAIRKESVEPPVPERKPAPSDKRAVYSSPGFYVLIAGAIFSVLVIASVFFSVKMIVSLSKKTHASSAKTVSSPRSAIPSKTKRSSQTTSRESPAKKTPLYLTIKVKRSVFVKAKKDGTVLFERVLRKDSVESLKAKDVIELYVARAESLELTLNGKYLGSPGSGLIKRLEITRKGFRIISE